MNRILFPTDFSEAADNAFLYALQLADALGADIITIHVYRLPEMRGVNLPNTVSGIYEDITLESFENFKDHVPHFHELAEEIGMSHIDISHMMVDASKKRTTKAILEAANSNDVSMIIMGTTGASGLKEIFLGSVAAEVLENANKPVLAVPKEAVFDGALDNIAVATNYADSEFKVIEEVLKFARLFDAQVHCVHVDVSHTEQITHEMDKFRARFKEESRIDFQVINHTSIGAAVSRYIDENGIDMLAMQIHQRNFLQELFTYSITKRMAYHLKVPIMGLHVA